MQQLRDRYDDDERVIALATAAAEDRELIVGAVHGGLAAVLIALLHRRLPRSEGGPALVVCADPNALNDDLDEFDCHGAVLPELDEFSSHEELSEGGRLLLARRVAALEAFAGGALLLATPRAAGQPVPDLAALAQRSIRLAPGACVELHQLAERLIEAGYRMSHTVERAGQIALRGGILDVFPLAAEHPLRLEFFGDEIDTIRRFDAFTQDSIARIDQAELATGGGIAADASLWSQLPPAPIVVLGDVPLRDRLQQPHGRRELRLAHQLPTGAVDGASLRIERFRGDLHRELSELRAVPDDCSILLLARNDEAARELGETCADYQIDVPITVGRLSAGFRDMQRNLLVLHDFELAHRRPVRRRSNRVAGGMPLSSLSDLKQGDYVVHVSHGIARFRGMATLERRGYLEDYLLLEFADEAKLYVPVTAIDLVQKYVGGSGRHPELSRMGGKSWARKRRQAEKAVEDLTAELLSTQAQRSSDHGIAFDPDSPTTRRFELGFPYEETEDQLIAMREIKADMEQPQAMDRLLCGDVGFGKTELAMRAACKAVASGYQVAVLAPTTILAEQHYLSFGERFAEFGTEVACLNRFRSAAERRTILDQVRRAEVGVLIGTHALLGEDLRFDNLGLLIIDEEHRFGVKAKERLKQVRTGVDVLALSATPIPRTLHFSLLGLRDISVLAEPPAQRLAVQTRVAPWDDALIRQALERELEREGQIFFVHNRIKDIDEVAFKLSRLVKDMRIEVVHGRMSEARIGDAMQRYRNGTLDCLLSTAIVESGLDIPNANTLFVNNAQAFGLSELHQLRGRIGRFTRQAHAYFLTPEATALSDVALERLEAIQEYAELGAGFKLAMRDLELRGAGNLLGKEQSGHIDAVGYELYCRLLAEAVRRRGVGKPGIDQLLLGGGGTALAFPLDAYVPDSYCESPALKFELHKTLEGCGSLRQLRELARRCRDRYGPLPPAVARLFQARAVTLSCHNHGIGRVEASGRQLRLHLLDGLPEGLAQVQLPELLHLQADGPILTLFTRLDFADDSALDFLTRLLELDLGFLQLDAAITG